MQALIQCGKIVAGPNNNDLAALAAKIGGKVAQVVPCSISVGPGQEFGSTTYAVDGDVVREVRELVDIPDERLAATAVAAVKAEAERRIFEYLGVTDSDNATWKQINAITADPPDLSVAATIKTIRDASNVLEAEIAEMSRDEVLGLDVMSWEGWPE